MASLSQEALNGGEDPGVVELVRVIGSSEWALYIMEDPENARANHDALKSLPPAERAIAYRTLAQDHYLRRSGARLGEITLKEEPLRILEDGQQL